MWAVTAVSLELDSPAPDYAGEDLTGHVFGPEDDLRDTDFRGTRLDGASLAVVLADDSNFTDASLLGSELHHLSCSDCQFVRASLDGANLHAAGLVYTDFADASLVDADLSWSHLGSSSFAGAVLRGADLSGANLTGTTFEGADLTGANLHEAWVGFWPSQSENPEREQIRYRGVVWSGTTCPDGTNSDDNAGTCMGHLRW